ncbi:hypothetical protein C5749_18960 [Sphingobacterium gobiense]|uniref:Uncharacterized protein n=1 Tax=Sphingobacterium gobiense TaxID=1382456 RepID=A0A2S9JD18_9SPHI|nr:hypothetical protein C5749_18960 [Sphingobacterium gobiense]
MSLPFIELPKTVDTLVSEDAAKATENSTDFLIASQFVFIMIVYLTGFFPMRVYPYKKNKKTLKPALS